MSQQLKMHLAFQNFLGTQFAALPATKVHETGWVDLVWAAITCGKKGPLYWVPHPRHAFAEAISRTFSVYSLLRQQSSFVIRSGLYEVMDASEKAAASYFLGMTSAKLVAEDYFDTPWLVHVSTAAFPLAYKPGRSRPDLIGRTYHSAKWIVLESKGRSNGFDSDALAKAKTQAAMVTYVNGARPICHIAMQTYLDPEMHAIADDPPAAVEGVHLDIDFEHALRVYYSVRHALRESSRKVELSGERFLIRTNRETGLTIGLPERIVFAAKLSESVILGGGWEPNSVPLEGRKKLFRDGFYIALDERWAESEMSSEVPDRIG